MKENFDKKDYGKVVERVGKLFKPSNETTTIGITNETKKLLDDIRDLGIKLPRATARVEDGEEKEQEEGDPFTFPPCIVTALALSRSMLNVVKDKAHQATGAKMVKEVSFRYPNARADEIGFSEFHEVLRVIVRADAMVRPEKMATVFEFSATVPRAPLKERSANAKPGDNCEVHPNAKVSHTNGECRQNEANPKFKLKFQKRERVEEGHKKVSKPKYDSDQKVLFIEEEESDIDEIYLTQTKNILCDTNNMLGVGCFSPNKI